MARVLLVDDHPDIRDVIGQMLEMNGHRVEICQTGELAILTLASSPPDAVIADQRLPGMSGIELLQRIRQMPSLDKLPVIICSADDSMRQEAEQAGASAFWLKGADMLFDDVERLGKQLE